ncbi:MAG: insulinase family protein [Oscillospiraceae bacterium]|nr:insulinase family protein [Oscillospiraceae bacterium]
MTNTRIENTRINESYRQIKHRSGLTVLLYPMEGYSSAYALFGTKYGSVDRSFKTGKSNDFTIVPDGIAHFLEHKLFENEEGDAFSLFAKTGASANAFTSFDRTCYLFSTTDNFEQSLGYLLSFVSSPYFTKETVEKEQGIIGQEIQMYRDDPEWRSFFGLLTAMYVNHPIAADIAGTEESIAEITPELLFDCYNTFYNLGNMILAIAGNFDIDSAMKTVDQKLSESEKITITRAEYDEPPHVKTPILEARLEVSIPIFTAGIKLAPIGGLDGIKAELCYEAILKILIGPSAPLYRALYDEGLINSGFSADVMRGDGYFMLVFGGESKNPELVYDRIKTAIGSIKEITQDQLSPVKRRMYGDMVRSFNNVQSVANNLVLAHFSDTSIYDRIETAANINIDDVNKFFWAINTEYSSISIIKPIEG